MKNVLFIVLFTILVTAFYAYVGQMVPQTEVHPPKDLAVGADMTTDDLVQVGRQIAEGKGSCMTCHTIGSHENGRFPDLGGIGGKAKNRRPGISDVDYLAESLYEPDAFIVEGFSPGMPPVHKAPTNLNGAEMLAVIAYLQSLGGTPSVTPATRVKYASSHSAQPPASSPAPVAAVVSANTPGTLDPVEILGRYGCIHCHSSDPKVKGLGPTFHGMGKRLTVAQLYESILDPDAQVAQGFPPAVMTATLKATGFYEKATAAEIQSMVVFLSSSQEGKK